MSTAMIKLTESLTIGGRRHKRSWQPRWAADVPTSITTPVAGGLAVLFLFVAGFGFWAVTAPLSGAVVAPGIVQASGENQVVEHLEGGIIREILVAEGDVVEAGEVIVTLDDTRALAERNRVRTAILLAQSKLARARAELKGLPALDFPESLLADARRQGLGEELEEQRAEFRSRLERHRPELAAIDQRIRASEEEMAGLEIQKRSEAQKLNILREEIADKKKLLDQDLIPRAQYNALRRGEADSIGRIGALTASIGERRAFVAQMADEQTALRAGRRETAAQQINELRATIGDLREQLRAGDDLLNRSRVRAPANGTIVTFNKNTIGATLEAGETIAEILPAASELIIEARVLPQDVDAVRVGQHARLRLVALNARTTPEVPARVTYLSADRLVDTATQKPYYTARLAFGPDLRPAISDNQVYPGMPADVLINTGERTFLEYLIRPVRDSLAKAFREE